MNNILSDDELAEKIAEAKSEMKEEILTYLRDCRDDLGCPGPESRALDRHIEAIERLAGV